MSLETFATTQLSMVPSLAGTMTATALVEAMTILDSQGHSNSSIHYLLSLVKHASQHDDPYQYSYDSFTAKGWTTKKPVEDENEEWSVNMQYHICQNILEVLQSLTNNIKSHALDKETVMDNFMSLAAYEPIVPIVDEPSEWIDTGGNMFQHRYMSSVFKDKVDGRPYYLDGVVFLTEEGATWTSGDSRMYVNLPCMATDLTRHIIKVDDDDRCINEQVYLEYLVLAEQMVFPNTEKRKPASML